jgi:SAM-dependent methyltransferase
MELITYILFTVLTLILLAGAVVTLLENVRHAKRMRSLDNEYAKLIAEFAKTTEGLDKLFIERSVTFEQNVAEMEKFMQAEYKSFLENIRISKQQTKEQSTISQMHVMDLPKTIPFENGTFDSILSTEVFEHIFNLDELLAELNRVLKLNGQILITCPFVYLIHEVPFDYARYTEYALKHLLEKNGFEIIKYDKKGNYIETICQQLLLYTANFIRIFGPLKNIKLFARLFKSTNALFFNITAKSFGKLLPSNYHFYSTNIVVAKKIK